MNTYEVVIIGAGLAGLHCARTLARGRVRVLLVDCKRSLSESVHTTGIFVRRTLEDFTLPADCLGPAIKDVILYSPARRRIELHSPYPEFRIGKMGMLYERYLDQCRNAGVDWLPNTRYLHHEDSDNGTIVHLATGSHRLTVQARFLIGADGANSRVARNLGLDANRKWIVGVEDVFADVPFSGEPRLHTFLDPKLAPGYLAWVAHDGAETHVGVGGFASQYDPAAALESFQQSLGGIIDLNNARRIERRAGRIPVNGVLRNICNSKGLLVGDAAGAVSPLTAGGLDPCLRLSNLAARVVVSFLESGDVSVLQKYSGNEFRSRFTSRLWLRRLFELCNSPSVQEFAFLSLRLPILNWLAWHVFFGRGSFPDVEEQFVSQPALGEP